MALTFVDLAVMEWWSWGLDCRTIRYNKILLQFTVLYTIHVNTVNCHHLKTVSMQYHVRQRPNCKYIQTIRMVTIHKWSFIFDGKVYSLDLNKMSTILNQCIRNKSGVLSYYHVIGLFNFVLCYVLMWPFSVAFDLKDVWQRQFN